MFCDTQWCIGGLKITTEKGSSGSVDPQPYSSRPHTARTAAKINNVKDFAVIILISVQDLGTSLSETEQKSEITQ